jgi:hypothetical protein
VPHSRFNIIHEIVEGDKRQLGFKMRVFAQMAAGVTWGMVSTRDLGMQKQTISPVLCSEALLDTKYVAQ